MALWATNDKTEMRHAQDAYNEWTTAKCIQTLFCNLLPNIMCQLLRLKVSSPNNILVLI